METTLMGLLFVGGAVSLALAGLLLVRRTIPPSFLETHHQVAGYFISVLGTVYAVLLAFVVYVVWRQYDEAKVIVSREAHQIGDLSRLAKGFPDPAQSRVRAGLVAYLQAVVDDEWPAMARRRESQRAWQAFKGLWDAFRDITPQSGREQVIYGESARRLTDLSDSRRLRLHASHEGVPTIMSIFLWGGAITTVLFTYFFGVKSLWSQALMTAALTAVISFILFLVVALSSPFAGDVRVTPEPFQRELERIRDVTSE